MMDPEPIQQAALQLLDRQRAIVRLTIDRSPAGHALRIATTGQVRPMILHTARGGVRYFASADSLLSFIEDSLTSVRAADIELQGRPSSSN